MKGEHPTLTGCCFKDVILSGSATGNPTMGFKSSNLISTLSLMGGERERERYPSTFTAKAVFTDIILCHSKPGRCEKDVLYHMREKGSY